MGQSGNLMNDAGNSSEKTNINVFLVDDHQLIREVIGRLIEKTSGLTLCQRRGAVRHALRQMEPPGAEGRSGDADRRRLAHRTLPRAAAESTARRAEPRARLRLDLQGLLRLTHTAKRRRTEPGPMARRLAGSAVGAMELFRFKPARSPLRPARAPTRPQACSIRCAPGARAGRSAAWRPRPPAARRRSRP
mgnify:CR=1 FL=1